MSVYFLAHGNLVKIGKAVDPNARVRTLQTAAFMRLRAEARAMSE